MKRRKPALAAVAGALVTLTPAVSALVLIASWFIGLLRTRARRRPPHHVHDEAEHVELRGGPLFDAAERPGVVLIILGAVLLGLPGALARAAPQELSMGFQTVAIALLVVVTRWWWRRGWVDRRSVAVGMAFGLCVLALAATVDAAGWAPEGVVRALGWGSFDGRASLWHSHPNILATAALLPMIAVAAWGTRRSKGAAATGALVLVAASGSRTVLAVLLVVMAVVSARGIMRAEHRRARSVACWLVIGAVATGVLLSTFTTLLDRFDPRLVFSQPTDVVNVLYASEEMTAASWSHVGVEVRRVGPIAPLRGDRTWAIEKTSDAWWARAQQGVSIPAGATLTLQVELLHADPQAQPGVHARFDGPAGPVEVTVRRVDGAWTLTTVRGVEVADWGVSTTGDWDAITISLTNTATATVPFALGLTPDQRPDTLGSTMWIRRPQARLGGPAAYAPTLPSRVDGRTSLGTLSDRTSWAQWAWSGFIERPLLGHGEGAFPAYAERRTLSERPPGTGGTVRTSHAHQLFAQTAFERGVAGLVGLLLVLTGLSVVARRGVPNGWWVIAPIVLVNILDVSFWTTPVSYTLGVVIGLAGSSPTRGGVPRADDRQDRGAGGDG